MFIKIIQLFLLMVKPLPLQCTTKPKVSPSIFKKSIIHFDTLILFFMEFELFLTLYNYHYKFKH